MNVVALVLSQFVALPTPLTIPPGGPLLIRTNLVRGSAAEFNGRTVIAFTSFERQVATGIPVVSGGDLWLATWDGVTVTSRLLCQATTPRFLEAHLAATSDRVLIVSRMTSGVNAVMLDAALQPLSAPCGAIITTAPADDLLVTASGNDFLVSYQNTSTGAVTVRWANSMGAFGNEFTLAGSLAVAARPSPVAVDGGVVVVFRGSPGVDLTVLQAGTMVNSGTLPGSAAHGSWTATRSAGGPLLIAWTQPAWQLVTTTLTGAPLGSQRVWMNGSAAPPALLALSTDAGIGVISWLQGPVPSIVLDVLSTSVGSPFTLTNSAVPVAVAPPAVLITREAPSAYGLRSVSFTAGQVGPLVSYVNSRPSHQQSVNVAWTPQGWLILWEEPRTQFSGLVQRSVVRAVLTDGRAANVSELVVDPVPGRSPRLRQGSGPGGQLLASFERPDGGSTIVTLTVAPPNLFVGTSPVVPDIGALGGFEVNAMALIRWTAGEPSTVYLGTDEAGQVQDTSPRGAFAKDTFWLPRSGVAAATPFALPGGVPLAQTTIANLPVDGPLAVGAAPHGAPTELLYAWNEPDAGLIAVLQTTPPMFDSSFTVRGARFFGGRPVRLADRWLVGLRPQMGGVLISGLHPTLSTSPLRLGPERGKVVEFESAEAPDGGSVAFVWTSWEDDAADAGLRLSFQVVMVRPDGGAQDGGSPDAGVLDAGVLDAGPSDAGAGDAGADAGASTSDGGPAAGEDAGVSDPRPDGDPVVFVPLSCGCHSSENALALALLAGMLLLRRSALRARPRSKQRV